MNAYKVMIEASGDISPNTLAALHREGTTIIWEYGAETNVRWNADLGAAESIYDASDAAWVKWRRAGECLTVKLFMVAKVEPA